MAASTERTVPSVNSFTLPHTLTAVLLANPGACVTRSSVYVECDFGCCGGPQSPKSTRLTFVVEGVDRRRTCPILSQRDGFR